MPATISRSKESAQRRERFREYMRNLNPTAPAQATIESGLVVEDLHGYLFKALAARADLDPGSQQLLVGGIGSGKTTELLMADKWLEGEGHSFSVYVDISSQTDLAGLNSGAVLAGFGLRLATTFLEKGFDDSLDPAAKKEMQAALNEIKEFAFGKTKSVWVDEEDYDPAEDGNYEYPPGHFVTHRIPGKLQPPFPALQRDIQAIQEPLEKLIAFIQARELDVIVIFDGFDRLISPDKFWAVVHQDFRALRRMQVAVIAAAPLSILYGGGRSVLEQFDRVHYLRTLSSEPGNDSHLWNVLIHRGTDLLGPDEVELICRSSGGVLRDLISLARDAGEAAYIEGCDRISTEHAKSAIRQLGESYLRGLGPDQLNILLRLDNERSFDVASRSNTELLVTGRVLEYSATDFRVHPALMPLI